MLMKKILRYSFVALLAMVFAPVFAEDIIWQEDFSSYAKDSVPSGGTYNYVCVAGGSATKIYTETLAGGTAPELLVGKKSGDKIGSFTATIPLNGKSGDMVLSYKANYDRLTVTATGATLGTKTSSGTSYSIPVTVAAGTQSITLTFTNTNSSNVRFDDAKLYQGTSKKPAGLSWGKASTSVTLGGDYTNIPTLQNSNNLDVVCKSSNDSVCTVTNAGLITVVGAGETTISAEFAGNDEYEAQTVSIVITVKAAIDPDAKGQQNNPYLMTDEDFQQMVLALDTISKPKSATIYVKGYITNIEEVSTEHGNATFKIAATQDTDAAIKIKVFRAKYLEKVGFTAENQIAVGDEVIICGQIQWYYPEEGNKEPQFAQGGYIYSLNGNTASHIDNVKSDNRFNGAIYNLAGQRVQTMKRGLYIINGKKVVK